MMGAIALALAVLLELQGTVVLRAAADGVVRRINTAAGERVEKGQVIIELDVPRLEDALKRRVAALQRAEAALQRAKTAVKESQTSVQSAERAQASYDTARAKLARSEKMLQTAQAAADTARAGVNQLRPLLETRTIVAPVPGRITQILVRPRVRVARGTPVVAMTPLDREGKP